MGLRVLKDLTMEISRDGDGINYRARSCSKWHWRHDEDQLLMKLVQQYGPRNWNFIAEKIRGRTGKSCRLRWVNQLNPEVKKAPFDGDEQEKLLQLHQIHGNKWSTIAQFFPGRTDNQVKNQYHIIRSRNNRQHLKRPFARRSQHRSLSSTSIFRPSRQKRGLISGSPSNLSHLRNVTGGTANAASPQLFDHPDGGLDNNFISSPLLTTTGSYALCPPLNCGGSLSYPHETYNKSNAAAFTDYAGGFNLGRNCHHNQGTNSIQPMSLNFISALMRQQQQRDEPMKHKHNHFIDFLGVEKSD